MRDNAGDGDRGMNGYLNARNAKVEAMKRAVMAKMTLFGSVGKA